MVYGLRQKDLKTLRGTCSIPLVVYCQTKMNFYYTYCLISLKDKKFYIGYTSDIERRVKEHQQGENISTSKRLPIKLIYY